MLRSPTAALSRGFGALLFAAVKPRGFDAPVLFVVMVAALYAVFIYAPTEREMGIVQRSYFGSHCLSDRFREQHTLPLAP